MASREETAAMKRALRLARYGKGNTFPNPMVGAVILDSGGNPAGDGFHRKCGAPHAEVVALASAGEDAREGTLVVTLEPCCHMGRTGPCTEEIIKSGIGRVVVAMEDPDPRMRGKGIQQLRDAGIDVETGVLSGEARELNRVYIHFQETSRSWVTLKMAMSLDGRIATPDGGSRWISCQDSRRLVHRKRGTVQAVMTGAGTVREDDPELTVRLVDTPPGGHPVRLVVTSSGDFGDSKKIFQGRTRVIVAAPEGLSERLSQLTERANVEIWEFPPDDRGRISLESLLKRTAEEGLGHIMVEAGSVLSTDLLRSKLVNSVCIFTAPKILGDGGRPAFGDLNISCMEEVSELKDVSCMSSGIDFLVEGEVVYRSD